MTQEEKNGFYAWMLGEFGRQDAQDFSGTFAEEIAIKFVKFRTSNLTARVEELTRENERLNSDYNIFTSWSTHVTVRLEEENARLTERLRLATDHLKDLTDLQNGPPLERYSKQWSEVMSSIYQFLSTDK